MTSAKKKTKKALTVKESMQDLQKRHARLKNYTLERVTTLQSQGRAVAAAMESIGRNPNSADRIQTPMIIGIAFIEALAIYALVIAFTLSGSV